MADRLLKAVNQSGWLFFWIAVLTKTVSSSLCLPDGIAAEQRLSLPRADGGEMPVGILAGNWPSAPLLSEIVMILIQEVLGYNAHVDPRFGDSGLSPIYGLAGCKEFNNLLVNKSCGEQETELHVSTDAWIGGYVPHFEEMRKEYPDIAPIDLGSVGYDGEETMYVSQPVFSAAYDSNGLVLDHHKSYNRSHHNAKQFFDSVSDLPLAGVYRCNESELANPSRIDPYVQFSNDADGAVKTDDGYIAKCVDKHWWVSPACRDSISECIPLLTGGIGWRLQALMQWAAAYDMPVAIAVVAEWSAYVNLISTKKVLFYWWLPDSTFINLQPYQVLFPRHNPNQWAIGDKKTSLATSPISNMVSADLSRKASKVHDFVSKVRFSLLEVQELLLQSTQDQNYTYQDVACKWVQDSVPTWSGWIPVSTHCREGFGMVDADAKFTLDRSNAVDCDVCREGTYSEEFRDNQGPTFRCLLCQPGYSQPNAYSTKCEPCAKGMVSSKWGSTSCVPCGVGQYQPHLAQTSCLACNESRTTRLLGAASDQDCVCQKDFIEEAVDFRCTPCGEGVLCPVGSSIAGLLNSTGNPNEPRVVNGYSSEQSLPLETYRCLESACPGGSPGTCGGGRIGPTCGRCPPNEFFSEGDGKCMACADGLLGIVALVFFGMGFATLVGYYMMPSVYRAKASDSFLLINIGGLTFSMLQVLGVLGSVLKEGRSNALTNFATIFVLDVPRIGLGCAGTDTAMYIMTACLFCSFPCMVCLAGAVSQAIPILKRKGLAWRWPRTISFIGSFLQASFTTIGSVALVPFMCYKHPIGKHSLLQYTDVFCGSTQHALMQWSSAVLLSLAAAFVGFCATGAWKAPSWARNSQKKRLQMITFLMHRFRPNRWWFGLVVLGKALGVSLPAVFFANLPSLLILFILLVLQLYLCFLLALMPWKVPILNVVDAFTTALIETLLALFLSGSGEVEGLSDAIDALEPWINFSIIGVCAFAAMLALVNLLSNFIPGKQLGLTLVHCGELPDPEKILTVLWDLQHFISQQEQGDELLAQLKNLSLYDADSILRSTSILLDDLQIATGAREFGTRITTNSRKRTVLPKKGHLDSGCLTALETDTSPEDPTLDIRDEPRRPSSNDIPLEHKTASPARLRANSSGTLNGTPELVSIEC